MNVYSSTYICKEETLLKSLILVNGVEFTSKALNNAAQSNAKQQNLVYNMPIASDRYRPQELNIKIVLMVMRWLFLVLPLMV